MPKQVAVNTEFFKTWSPEMAYVLGFFTADGCLTINPRGSHYIELACNDRDVLEKIRRAMNSKHKIGSKTRTLPNQKQGYRLQIGSKAMFGDLQKLGFTVKKSNTVTLPDIPKPYLNDFLRGYFDGDGSVTFAKYWRKNRGRHMKCIVVVFTSGSKQLLSQLARRIRQQLNITTSKVIYHQGYRLSYWYRKATQLLEKLYERPTIFMQRKFDKSHRALKFYLGT